MYASPHASPMAMTARDAHILKLAVLALLVGGALAVFSYAPVRDVLSAAGFARVAGTLRTSWWGPPAFVLLYAVLVTFDFSGLALTLTGGAVFGFWPGVLLNTIGANLGANGAYWLARTLGRDGVRALGGKRLAQLQDAASERGAMWLFRLRLIPVVPFNMLDLAAGLSGMRWRGYAIATVLGILPGTLAYTYFADAITSGVAGRSREAFMRALGAGLALVALTFVPAIARRFGWLKDA